MSEGPAVESTVLTTVVLPIALAIVMLGMGLGLAIADFKRVLAHPKAVMLGVFCQMLVLPALAYGVVRLFDMPPELGVGLMILALCPGGVTSNVFSMLARGDVALSVSLTAVVSVVTPFTIPLIGGAAMSSLLGDSQTFSMPLGKTIAALFIITAIPVSLGMLIKSRAPAFAERAEKTVRIVSVVLLFIIIAGIMKRLGGDKIASFFSQAGWPALALNIVSMGVGVGVALLFNLRREQVVTIGVEVGIQNGTTALLVTSTILESPTMAVAPAIYSLIMFATGGLFAFVATSKLVGGSKTADAPPQPSRG